MGVFQGHFREFQFAMTGKPQSGQQSHTYTAKRGGQVGQPTAPQLTVPCVLTFVLSPQGNDHWPVDALDHT